MMSFILIFLVCEYQGPYNTGLYEPLVSFFPNHAGDQGTGAPFARKKGFLCACPIFGCYFHALVRRIGVPS